MTDEYLREITSRLIESNGVMKRKLESRRSQSDIRTSITPATRDGRRPTVPDDVAQGGVPPSTRDSTRKPESRSLSIPPSRAILSRNRQKNSNSASDIDLESDSSTVRGRRDPSARQENPSTRRDSNTSIMAATVTMKEENDIDVQLLDCFKMRYELNTNSGSRDAALLLQAMRQVWGILNK